MISPDAHPRCLDGLTHLDPVGQLGLLLDSQPLDGLHQGGLGHVGCRHPLAGLLEVSLQLLVQAPIEVGRGDDPRDPHGRLVVDPFVPEELVAMWASPPCLWVYHLPGDAVGLSVRSARGWTGAAASASR